MGLNKAEALTIYRQIRKQVFAYLGRVGFRVSSASATLPLFEFEFKYYLHKEFHPEDSGTLLLFDFLLIDSKVVKQQLFEGSHPYNDEPIAQGSVAEIASCFPLANVEKCEERIVATSTNDVDVVSEDLIHRCQSILLPFIRKFHSSKEILDQILNREMPDSYSEDLCHALQNRLQGKGNRWNWNLPYEENLERTGILQDRRDAVVASRSFLRDSTAAILSKHGFLQFGSLYFRGVDGLVQRLELTKNQFDHWYNIVIGFRIGEMPPIDQLQDGLSVDAECDIREIIQGDLRQTWHKALDYNVPAQPDERVAALTILIQDCVLPYLDKLPWSSIMISSIRDPKFRSEYFLTLTGDGQARVNG